MRDLDGGKSRAAAEMRVTYPTMTWDQIAVTLGFRNAKSASSSATWWNREGKHNRDKRRHSNGAPVNIAAHRSPISTAVVASNEIRYVGNMDDKRGLPAIAESRISLTMTSPPYWDYVVYGGKGSGTEESYAEYIAGVASVMAEVLRVTEPGGKLVLNVSNMKSRLAVEKRAFVYPIVADLTKACCEAGWVFYDESIWVKSSANAGALGGKILFGSYPYPPTPKLLDSTFENVLVFQKEGAKRKRTNEQKAQSKLTQAEWATMTQGVWRIHPDVRCGHPASFPLELAERVVRMYSFVGDVVLDPYAGSGTTMVACAKWGREGLGFEIERSYMKFAKEKFGQHGIHTSISGRGNMATISAKGRVASKKPQKATPSPKSLGAFSSKSSRRKKPRTLAPVGRLA